MKLWDTVVAFHSELDSTNSLKSSGWPSNKAPSPGSSHQQSAALTLIETVEKDSE